MDRVHDLVSDGYYDELHYSRVLECELRKPEMKKIVVFKKYRTLREIGERLCRFNFAKLSVLIIERFAEKDAFLKIARVHNLQNVMLDVNAKYVEYANNSLKNSTKLRTCTRC